MKRIVLLFVTSIFILSNAPKLFAQDECSKYIVYIDKNKLPMTINEWEAKDYNIGMVRCEKTIGEDLKVDLYKSGDSTSKKNKLNVPIWFQNNSAFIDYDKSFPYIRESHLINVKDSTYKKYVNRAESQMIKGDLIGYTFYELKNIYGIDCNNPSYDPKNKCFLRVKRNIFNNVKLNDVYTYDEQAFSYPLLISIVKNKGIKICINDEELKKCYFSFTIFENNLNEKVVIMKFTRDGVSEYYNFSDDPIRGLLKKNEIK